MARDYVVDLMARLHTGKISRRDFAKRAAAAGLSAGLIGQALRVASVRAQDATGTKASDIGLANVEHMTDTSKGTIKFYSSWPTTGQMKGTGGDAVVAVELCLEDFGSAAGGFAIEYEAMDDSSAANPGKWDTAKESENANKAVNDPDAMVYLGTYNSNAAKVSIPILNAVEPAGMAMISFANTYPGLTAAVENATEPGEPEVYYPSGKRTYMRVVPHDELQGVAGANWAYNKLGKKKAFILHDLSLYGEGVATIFRLQWESLGGEVLGFEGYEPTAGDYQTKMTSIADSGPDILYVGATVENNPSKVLQDMRSVMTVEDTIFLGPDGLFSQSFIDGAGDAAEGAYVTFAGFPPGELEGPGADYATRMEERLGYPPDAYAVYSYEAVVVALQAIDQVQEKDRGMILDAMAATEGFVSLLGGSWSFDANGDTDAKKMSVNIIEGTGFSFVEDIGAV